MIKNAHYDKQNTCIERTKYMANDIASRLWANEPREQVDRTNEPERHSMW